MRWLALLPLAFACNPADTDPDADSDTELGSDTDTDTSAFEPLSGFGTLSGACGPLDEADLEADEPVHFTTALDLPGEPQATELSAGGQEILTEGNLNSGSLYSEIFAYEVLYRCEEATLLLTEGEVTYDNPNGKKTDLVVLIEGVRVGVSVTRAVGWPRDAEWTVAQAVDLLEDKLADVPLAADNASDSDAWARSALHVIAYSPDHALAVENGLAELDSATRGDTIVFVTATNGDDGFIYGD